MEQPTLFDLETLQESDFDKRKSLMKMNYSPLLRFRPNCEDDEFLYVYAVAYRRILGDLLIDLSKGKLEATDYLTNPRYRKDRVIVCDIAHIDERYLNIWIEQIQAGALCFNYRILIDSIRNLLDIHKNKPPADSAVVEDWSDAAEINKNQYSFDF